MERNVKTNSLLGNLSLPILVAPMFRVSSPELVIASCNSGVIGSFPSQNCRTTEKLDKWLEEISKNTKESDTPYAINLVMRNERLIQDLELTVQYRVPIVISSVGSPEQIIGPVHEYGGLVFSDVATLKHAKKAAQLGVDGLILLCAGAGGNAGWLNPFAFVRAVREFYDGIIVLAGSVMDGVSIRAAEVLGANLVYMGTRFIATKESLASNKYKKLLTESDIDDVITTTAFSGMKANFLKSSIEKAGLDPNNLPSHEEFSKSVNRKKRWKDIWSSGQGVTAVKEIETCKEIVNQLKEDYYNH